MCLGMLILPLLFSCFPETGIDRRIKGHVYYLASDQLCGRKPCTPGDTLATEYITDHFRRLGLTPRGSSGSYLQPFNYRKEIVVKRCSLQFTVRDSTWVLRPGRDYFLRYECEDATFTGEVAFIGYGIRSPEYGIDDFTALDLRGKTAVYYATVPREWSRADSWNSWRLNIKEKAALIATLGGKAAVYVSPELSEYQKRAIIRTTHRPQNFVPKPIPVIAMAGAPFRRLMELAGLAMEGGESPFSGGVGLSPVQLSETRATIHIQTEDVFCCPNNIIAELQGRDEDRTIIIGAHYDHVGIKPGAFPDSIRNGADDNASGTALLMEIASYFALKENLNHNLLFIAFGAEESGCMGSEHFLANPSVTLPTVTAMVNFDMVGRMRGDTLFVFGIHSSPKWESYLTGRDTNLLVIRKYRYNGSDADVFGGQGMPAVTLTTGPHKDHTRSSDEADRINYNGMARIYRYAIDLIRTIDSWQ